MKRDLDTFPPSQQAGILCGQERFREFAASRLQLPSAVSSAAAGEFVRRECDVTSRADLDHFGDAARRWNALRTEYDAWRGRIAPQQGR